MPEGPEIHNEAKRISRILINSPLESVTFTNPDLQKYSSDLLASKIEKIEPWGKVMLIYFHNEQVILSHNQLYGKWKVLKKDTQIQSRRQVRLILETAKGKAILFSASTLEVLNIADLKSHRFLKKLGPDILWDSTTEANILQRLNEPSFQRRTISHLMLSQDFFAGIGNYLRSEILFIAGIHPDKKLQELSQHEKEKLAHAIKLLPKRSFEQRGITVSPEEANIEKEKGIRRGYYRFYVFSREGWACRICDTPIKKIQRSSRRLYMCENCQKWTETH